MAFYHIFKGRPTNFLTIFFDFSYFICISPYRFVIERNGTITVKQWRLQKILCALVHLLGILYIILYRWRNITKDILERDSTTAQFFFFTFSHVTSHLLTLVTLYTVWRKRQDFITILELLYEKDAKRSISVQTDVSELVDPNYASYNRKTSFVGKLIEKRFFAQVGNGLAFKAICVSYLCASLFYAYFQVVDLLGHWCCTWSWKTFNFTKAATKNPKDGLCWDMLDTPFFGTFILVISCLSAVARGMTRYIGNLLLVSGVLSLWNVVHLSGKYLKGLGSFFQTNCMFDSLEGQTECRKEPYIAIDVITLNSSSSSYRVDKLELQNQFSSKTPDSTTWTTVYGKYQKLRKLAKVINSTYRLIVILSMARAVSYYSANMVKDSTSTVAIQIKILMALMALNDIIVFLFAADINSQMDNFRTWISSEENRKLIPVDELYVMLHEFNNVPVGIRGGNLFVITYSLLWTALTTVMTYFIIFDQHKVKDARMISKS